MGIVIVDALDRRGGALHERVMSRLEMDQSQLAVFQPDNDGDAIAEWNHGDIGDDPCGKFYARDVANFRRKCDEP